MVRSPNTTSCLRKTDKMITINSKKQNSLINRLCKELDILSSNHRALKREARKRKWVKRLNFINDKGQALCKSSSSFDFLGWVSIAAFVIYKTNFFRELWENPHRVMFFFVLSMIGLGVNLASILYLTIYLPIIKGIPEKDIDIEKVHPMLIPIMTLAGLVSFFW